MPIPFVVPSHPWAEHPSSADAWPAGDGPIIVHPLDVSEGQGAGLCPSCGGVGTVPTGRACGGCGGVRP